MEHESPVMPEAHKRIVERIISLTLQIGVIASVVLVLAGTILTFAHHPEYVHDPATLDRLTGQPQKGQAARIDPEFPATAEEMWKGLLALKGQAVIVLGLMVLVATPVLRVAISVFIFMVEKDWTFVVITLIVLALLLSSSLLGKAEG
jgi:uncharacterized membrane protein